MIKVYLQKLDRNIIFQILEQSDQCYIGEIAFNINNIEVNVYSRVRPDIRIHRTEGKINKVYIFLRGNNKKRDLKITTLEFENNKERDLVYNTILKSFKNITRILHKKK